MREEDDPIFGGKEPLPDDLVRLQKALSRLPLPPEPDWAAVQPARRRAPTAAFVYVYAYAAAAAALIVALSGTWLARDAWRVDAIAGAPSLRGLAFGGRVALLGSIATDDRSRARLEVRGLGRVDLEPGTLLRRVPGRGSERRLALVHGMLHALILAPPRQFVVETPVGAAIDLGCAYTLSISRAGHGRLAVTSGRVTFTGAGRESFVPAGTWCPLGPGGVGAPRRDYASDGFLAAIAAYDSLGHPAAALDGVLAAAEASDAITLWHLLPRVGGAERARVAERIDELIEVPAGVARERVLALDPAALDAWWEAVGMGSAGEWRAWPRKELRWP